MITVNVYIEYIGKDMDQHDEDLLKRVDVSFLAQSEHQLDPICYDGQHSLN